MKIVEKEISVPELKKMSEKMFGNLVKAVVDVEQETMAVDADLHADQEKLLLEQGSKQENLWGINLYPEFFGKDEFIEFDSMINLRPRQNNGTRGVDDSEIQNRIRDIVDKIVKE